MAEKKCSKERVKQLEAIEKSEKELLKLKESVRA
jgi:hypothetical protein